jgi:hypothetical protein
MASDREVGRITDDFSDLIIVEVDQFTLTAPDGSVSPAGAVLISVYDDDDRIVARLSGKRLDAFRELLGRAATPGQPATEAPGGQ